MKKIIFKLFCFGLLTLVFIKCSNSDSNFSIEGTFKRPVEVKTILGSMGIESITVIDSAKTDENGIFNLNGSCEASSLFLLNYLEESIYLIIKPGDEIDIEIDNTINPPSYYVSGSSESRLVREITFEQKKVLNKITQISHAYEESKDDPETFLTKKRHYDSLYDDLLTQHKAYTIEFIENNPGSLATIFALYQNFGKSGQALFDKFEDFEIFNIVDSNLSMLYSSTPAVIALNNDVSEIKEQLEFKKYSDRLIQPGRQMPDFSLNTIEEIDLSLNSDFKDKSLAIVFFAVWNKPSVEEVKQLNELYQKYRYNGFRVIGISFDTSEEKLGSFIQENEIKFPVVCDYLYWDSEYTKKFGVMNIPDIILLNRNHIIEKRNINSSEIKLILEEWRKNNLF